MCQKQIPAVATPEMLQKHRNPYLSLMKLHINMHVGVVIYKVTSQVVRWKVLITVLWFQVQKM